MGWLGVDEAASTVLEIADRDWFSSSDGRGASQDPKGEREREREISPPVFHILNPDTTHTWNRQLLPWTRALMPHLSVLSPREWLDRLERLEMEHPAKKLLGLWRSAYCSSEPVLGEEGKLEDASLDTREVVSQETVVTEEVKGPFFSIEKAKEVAPTMRGVKPVSEEHFGKMWRWVEGNVGGIEKRA